MPSMRRTGPSGPGGSSTKRGAISGLGAHAVQAASPAAVPPTSTILPVGADPAQERRGIAAASRAMRIAPDFMACSPGERAKPEV